MLRAELTRRLFDQQNLTIHRGVDWRLLPQCRCLMQEGAHQTPNCTLCALRSTLVRGTALHNGNICRGLWHASTRSPLDVVMKLVAQLQKSATLTSAGNLRG